MLHILDIGCPWHVLNSLLLYVALAEMILVLVAGHDAFIFSCNCKRCSHFTPRSSRALAVLRSQLLAQPRAKPGSRFPSLFTGELLVFRGSNFASLKDTLLPVECMDSYWVGSRQSCPPTNQPMRSIFVVIDIQR